MCSQALQLWQSLLGLAERSTAPAYPEGWRAGLGFRVWGLGFRVWGSGFQQLLVREPSVGICFVVPEGSGYLNR